MKKKGLFNQMRFGVKRFINKMDKTDKRLAIIIIAGIFIAFIFYAGIIIYDQILNGKYATSSECVEIGKQIALSYQNTSWWQIILINNAPLLCLAVALGWIFHGVGFKVIG